MKKIRASIRNKELLTLALIILLFFLIRFALIMLGTKLGETRENEQNQIKMNMLMNIVSDGNAKRAVADERITGYEAADVRLVTGLLRNLVTEDGYTGPMVLPGGFVAKLRDGHVILPKEYQAFSGAVTCGMIEAGLAQGSVMGNTVRPEPAEDAGASETGAGIGAEDRKGPAVEPCFLTFEKITEDTVYVSMMTESEYNAFLDRYSTDIIHEALESADAAFGGISLAVRNQDDALSLVWQIGMNGEGDALSVLGLTEEMIKERIPLLMVDGQEYQCAYDEIVSRSIDKDHLIFVQLLPLVSLREQNIKRALLVDLVMSVIFLVVTVYVLAVQRYTTEHELTREQAEQYRPDKMRTRMMNVGLLGILITFALALLIESVGQFYVELRYGRDTLNIVSRQLETTIRNEKENAVREGEPWYTYYGEEMASLLAEYPDLASRETLQACCDALELDYIMLFDADGMLYCSSGDFSGLTVTNEKNNELYGFHRLLYGIPGSIRLDTTADGVTGVERHLIGVKISDAFHGKHGALIMALMPETVAEWSSLPDGDQPLIAADGTYCFAADSGTGEILYSSAPALVGKTIQELGLSESSLRDGYMDLTAVSGDRYLVVTSREGDWVYFFGVSSETMFRPVLQYGLVVAAMFALMLTLLLIFLLGGYNEKAYQDWMDLYAQSKEDSTGILPESDQSGRGTRKLGKLSAFVSWDRKLPREKMTVVLHVGLIILLTVCVGLLHGEQLTNESYNTLLGFLLYGDWMRGPNLFGLCCMLLVIAVAYLINLLSILILNLSAKLSSESGKTINRLLYNCIKYATAFGAAYFGLAYLGLPTGALVASLGAISLALSLGARSLIEDILAGLSILFNRSVQIGDVVTINGTRGTIEEIGVRCTKMRIPGDNILILNNHEIKSILNMSKFLSVIRLEIKVPTDLPLIQLEEMLNRELPGIGEKCTEILYGPCLIGVTELTSGNAGMMRKPGTVIAIGANIQEKDSTKVKLFLNREIKLLFEREGIELL